ncbi:UNVERIFIED_CONTAM: peptidylprolyl isomerase, partial [Bacillus subtilis]
MEATLHTNYGDIKIDLYPEHAPETVANFTELATGKREWLNPRTGEPTTDPLYDGVIVHRVIAGFMIQGGDPLGTGPRGPG